MTNETARRVMILAHAFRRAAAARFNCKTSEINWSECLKMAWAEVKAEASKPKIVTNEKGFVVFNSRNWSYTGDKNTWARVNNDTLTINVGKGIISSEYMEELEAFVAPFGLNITAGRMVVAL